LEFVFISSVVAVLASLFKLLRPILESWLHPQRDRHISQFRARRKRPEKVKISIERRDGTTKSVAIDSWFAHEISEEDIRRIAKELEDAKSSNEQATGEQTK